MVKTAFFILLFWIVEQFVEGENRNDKQGGIIPMKTIYPGKDVPEGYIVKQHQTEHGAEWRYGEQRQQFPHTVGEFIIFVGGKNSGFQK